MVKKLNHSKGQSLVEYVALTALVAIVSIGAVKMFGGKVQRRLTQITKSFDNNLKQGLKHEPGFGDEEDGVPWPGGIKLPRGIHLPGGFPDFGQE